MNLVYIKSKILDTVLGPPEKIIQYNLIEPVNAYLEAGGITKVEFSYDNKCIYTDSKCIERFLRHNPYINNVMIKVTGRNIKDVHVERIFILNVEPTSAIITERYRLYDAMTRTFIPDPIRNIDRDPLIMLFGPYKYQNRGIYDRIQEIIKNK